MREIYKVDAQGDTIYIEAICRNDAREILFRLTGPIPESLLTWSVVKKVPKGEEALR